MARIYADEQYPLPVVEFLRPLGHDVFLSCQSAESFRPPFNSVNFL
jgi:hypothetical protein